MKTEKTIPYKIYLDEQEMPKKWYNVRADMKNKPAPLLNPGTLQPMTAEELGAVFCSNCGTGIPYHTRFAAYCLGCGAVFSI